MEISGLIMPMGIATYVFLLLAALSGLLFFKYHVKWIKLKWHIWFGYLTLVLGTLHAVIVIFTR